MLVGRDFRSGVPASSQTHCTSLHSIGDRPQTDAPAQQGQGGRAKLGASRDTWIDLRQGPTGSAKADRCLAARRDLENSPQRKSTVMTQNPVYFIFSLATATRHKRKACTLFLSA